ncbi:MAG: hypothetical protein KDD41_05360 [Flavobacteriales bacterium]|nr:hypothetical protein [Flavobacteriales bacterium]
MNYYSKIFWHFTGSPKDVDWGNINYPKDILINKSPKSIGESIEILKLILDSRKLKATCSEKIIASNTTENFCCVTDIPLINLKNHRRYYGDVAIGFSSQSIYSSFHPVFYIPRRLLTNNLVERIESIVVSSEEELNNIGIDEDTAMRSGFEKRKDGRYNVPVTEVKPKKLNDLEQNILSFLKSTEYGDDEGDSFYQEREWRKIQDFDFNKENVTGIIVPQEYIEDIINYLSTKGYNNVNVLSWEFIEKS